MSTDAITLTTVLGRYAAGLREQALAPATRHAAKRCVADWFAAALPGSVIAPASALKVALADELGAGRARVLPGDLTGPPRTVAMLNATAAHAVEFDDIFREAVYHPGAPVISSALAIAENEGLDGETLLRTVVAGYEVSNRIGRAVIGGHYRFWHPTGTVGTFGAAAAAAVALGLDGDRIGHALANAATFAAGLQQTFRSDAHGKPMHAGHAANGGVLAALGAREGVVGAQDMLEGEAGFGAAMGGSPDWGAALADLESAFTIEQTTQKNHGCCGHSFAALDGIIALRNEHGLSAEAVRRIHVGTYGTAVTVVGNASPRTTYEAKFSLPYCAAVALIDGSVRLRSFTEERLGDRRVRAVMDKVVVELDAAADAAFPGRRSATVTIEADGHDSLHHHAPTRKGDPENPLTDAEIDDKYHELAGPVLGEAVADALLARIHSLETLDDVRALQPTARLATARSA